MEITKREILASLVIVFIMIGIGALIGVNIKDSIQKNNEMYSTALKIKDKSNYDYAIETEQGNIVTQGVISAIKPVKTNDLSGEFLYIKKITERYTQHTEVYTDSNGKTKTRTYWSWDVISSDETQSEKIKLYNHTYDTQKFNLTSHSRREGEKFYTGFMNKRHFYYVIDKDIKGTFFAEAGEKGLASKNGRHIEFSSGSIDDFMGSKVISGVVSIVFFWIGWSVLTVLLVLGFVSLENNWLEEKRRY